MHCRTNFLLFSVILASAVLPLLVDSASSQVTSFFWLKLGTQASYVIPEGPVIFDDYGSGHPFRGNYSWRCLDVNDTHSVLDVEIMLELFKPPEWITPAHVTYFGSEFVEKAKNGDLSFIKRIPMDQVVGRIEIGSDPGNPSVSIPSPIVLHQKFTVTVDLDTMMMVDDNGEPWGKWVLWIDPLKYPLSGWQNPTVETFVLNWLNTTVDVNIFYVASADPPFDTILGTANRYFYAGVNASLRNELLTELGWSGMWLACRYEPRTGILYKSSDPDFTDDILTQRFGIVGVHSWTKDVYVQLSEMVFVGDLNSDWVVNILDLTVAAAAFGTKPGDGRWNQVADVNRDSVVNIVDIAMIARTFGTQYITTD